MICYSPSRHRVVPAAAPGVAAQDALDGQPAAFEHAVLLDGLDGVLRTGGHVAAARGDERRDADAVHVHRQQHDELDDLLHGCSAFSWMVCRAFTIFFSM